MLNDIVSIRHRQGKITDAQYKNWLDGIIDVRKSQIALKKEEYKDSVKQLRTDMRRYNNALKKLGE